MESKEGEKIKFIYILVFWLFIAVNFVFACYGTNISVEIGETPLLIMNSEPEFTKGKENEVSWEKNNLIKEYFVQCAKNISFSEGVLESGWLDTDRFTFTSLEDNTKYYYRVKGKTAEGRETTWSNIVFSTQDNNPPRSYVINPISKSQFDEKKYLIKVSSQDLTSGVKEVAVYYRTTESNWTILGKTSTGEIEFLPNTKGTRYSFYSIAEDNVGNIEEKNPTEEAFIEIPPEASPEPPSTKVEKTALQNAATAVSSVTGAIATSSMIGLTNIGGFWMPVSNFLMSAFGWRRRKPKPWGLIYNSLTREAIPFAIIRVKNENGNVIDTAVSDELGRFAILPPSERFRVEVEAVNFKFPSSIIAGLYDPQYGKVYHGEMLDPSNFVLGDLNIPLDPFQQESPKIDFKRIFQIFLAVLFYVGAILSGIALFQKPVWYTMLLFFIYLFLIGLDLVARFYERLSFGIVLNAETRKPIMNAFIYLVDHVTNKVIDTRMSDKRGRFQIFVPAGRYLLRIIHPAYKEEQRLLDFTKKINLITGKFKLTKVKTDHSSQEMQSMPTALVKPFGQS
jgi:hypothetical protein